MLSDLRQDENIKKGGIGVEMWRGVSGICLFCTNVSNVVGILGLEIYDWLTILAIYGSRKCQKLAISGTLKCQRMAVYGSRNCRSLEIYGSILFLFYFLCLKPNI